MKVKSMILSLAIVGLSQGVFAQNADSTQQAEPLKLTLDAAKTYALEHNRTVQAADLNVKKAEIAKWESLSNMLLNVSADLSYTNMLGYSMNFAGQSINMPPYGQLGITASVAINGQMVMGYQMSKLAVEMQKLSQTNDELSVKQNVTTSFLTVLIAEESFKILEECRNNLKKTSDNIEQLVKVGMAQQTDADQIRVQLMTMDNQIRSTKRNIELAYNALRIMLGCPVNQEIDIEQDLDYFFENEDAAKTLDNQFSAERNVNVQLLDKNIELSEKTVNLKRWAYGPTLSVAYQFSKKTYFNADKGFDMTPPNVLNIGLNIPIFSSGNRRAAVQKAKIDVDIAQTQREQTVDQLLVQDSQLRFNLSNAIDNYQANKETVALNKKIFKNYLQKFEQGMVSSTDLISVNNNLLQAESAYIQSLYDVMSAQTSLLQLYNLL